ncbi:MAG: helix-turn-helix domain-containing protein, partial [Enterococcus hulanensis]
SVFRLLLEVLLTAIKNGLKEKSYQKKEQEHPVVTAVYKEILENYSDPNLSLQVVADNAGVSQTYLSTLFSQSKGKNFIDALTEIRLDHAKELLRETDLLITAIAFEIGYNDPNYFSYLFKKKIGVSPKAFRNSQNK